ncbi:MAG TPA: hypothetical protein VK363_19280 [Pyrinomonadaceae bacterium]|nr:hypothetical protein [Pyrinomonadaceae bacterium]
MKNNTGKTTEKGTAKKTARRMSASDHNENYAELKENQPHGTPAYNLFYTIGSMPAFVQSAIADALSRAAAALNLPDPNADGLDEREEFKRVVEIFKAAGDELFLNDPQGDEGTPEQAARNLVRFMASNQTHDFITDALVDAVMEAAHAHNMAAPDLSAPESEQIKIMTDLFAVVPGIYSQRDGRDEITALAYHLSEALRIARHSKDAPTGLFDALGEANNDHISNCLDMDSREAIELALRQRIQQAERE